MQTTPLVKDKRLQIIFGITLVAVMGVASLTPAFPKMADTLHLTKSQVGYVISAFTFPGIFLAPLTGILADRWGRKKILVPSLFLFGLAGFAIFFTRNFYVIIALRAVQGIGAASLGSLNATLVGDFFKGPDRPAAMGYNASVLSLSTALYPLIGGALAGIAWYYPFLLPLLAIPVGLVVALSLDEPEIVKVDGLKSYLKIVSRSVLRKEVISIFILSLLTFVILYGAFLTYLPFLLHSKFQLSAPKIGLFFSLSSITTAVFSTQTGKLTHRFGSLTLLKAAFALYLATTLVLPNAGHIVLVVVAILFFGSAQAMNIPSLQTVLAGLAPDNQRGAFMSTNGMVLRLGQTLGPLLVGIGYTWGELQGAYYFAAGMACIGLLVLFTMTRRDIEPGE